MSVQLATAKRVSGLLQSLPFHSFDWLRNYLVLVLYYVKFKEVCILTVLPHVFLIFGRIFLPLNGSIVNGNFFSQLLIQPRFVENIRLKS